MDPIHDESFVSAMLEDTSARGVFQVNEGVKPVDVKEAVLAGHKEQWWDLAPSTGKEEEAGGEEAKEGETQQPTPVASEAASEETKWWENEFEVGDAGSPSLQVASRSRERLVGILRAISNEVSLIPPRVTLFHHQPPCNSWYWMNIHCHGIYMTCHHAST